MLLATSSQKLNRRQEKLDLRDVTWMDQVDK
jgi:hypothetical protein